MPTIPETTAEALAGLCGGRLVGDAALAVRGIRAVEAAGPSDLTFAADRRAARRAAATPAGVVLVRPADALPPERTQIEVGDPSAALGALLLHFFPPRRAAGGIHPTAVVDATAAVDPAAEIGPFAVVGPLCRVGPGTIVDAHVVLGSGCSVGAGAWLHPHVVLYDGVRLGDRVEVHSGTVLGADGFGYAPGPRGIAKVRQVGTVEIEADVEIGANSCVDRATLEMTRIGAGTKVDDLVMVGHNCQIGRHTLVCGQAGLAGSSIVGDGVILAGQVGVGGHLKIGNGVKAGAQTGISGDVPDGAEINGSPHLPYRDSLRVIAETRRLPETARLAREAARKLGIE